MLNLKWKTPQAWVVEAEQHLEEILIDHAHCEKKAAGVGMNMIFAYVTCEQLVRELSTVVQEELQHLKQALALLNERGFQLRSQIQSSYGQRLGTLIRREEPHKAVDRCLVAALIEARSCERFTLLRDHLEDRELAGFYGSLLESEARHRGLYVRLAQLFAPRHVVLDRLEELLADEARIIQASDPFVRLHS